MKEKKVTEELIEKINSVSSTFKSASAEQEVEENKFSKTTFTSYKIVIAESPQKGMSSPSNIADKESLTSKKNDAEDPNLNI